MRCQFCGIKYSDRNEGESCDKSLTGYHYPFVRYEALVRACEEAAQRMKLAEKYLRDSMKAKSRR